MELRAFRSPNAVDRPLAAVHREMRRNRRMPVPRRIDRCALRNRRLDVSVQSHDDAVAAGNCQGPPWAEVILYIDQEQGALRFHALPQFSRHPLAVRRLASRVLMICTEL